MKRLMTIVLAAVTVLCACAPQQVAEAPMAIIFDTDLGNDVDDAVAMDILFKYAYDGKVNILAEGISKDGLAPAEYMDILCFQ